MSRHRLSIRAATTLAMIFIGSLFVLLSWTAGTFFRDAALESQIKSLSRIIEVASNQVLRTIEKHALNLNMALNEGGQLSGAFEQFQRDGDQAPLLRALDDPLVNGFSDAADIDLVKLRVYDLKLNFLLESRVGMEGLPPRLPDFMHLKAFERSGVDRLKTIGGLWVSEQGPLYSMLLPLGGLMIQGYLEIVINPTFSLAMVGDITGMPLGVTNASEPPSAADISIEQSGLLPVEYLLIGEDQKPAYRLVGIEDVRQFYQDMRNNQATTTAVFVSITFIILLLMMFLLNRGIFKPLKQMLQGIEFYRRGELDIRVKTSGLRELFTLGQTFNAMIEQIEKDINELERHSHSDGLTGLGNRRYFEKRLHEEWSRAIRLHSPLSLLFIDIDHFKRYNDHYGHLQGDDCLRRVAEAIHHAVKRDIDVAARYGGEEFVIMLPDTDMAGAEQVGRELQQAIRKLQIEHRGSNVKPFITLSIGIATRIPCFPEKPQELLQAADTALYQAKERGRNRIGKVARA